MRAAELYQGSLQRIPYAFLEFFNQPLGYSLFRTSFLLSSARGFRLQRTGIAIWVRRILSHDRHLKKTIASNIKKFALSDQSCFSRPGMVCWPTLDKDLFRHPRLQPAPSEAAGRAWRAAANGTVINLIVTSTALNIRLVQEAHKRKLSAVTWVLLLRERGKEKNKSQHYLSLQPAKDKASFSSTAVLFVLVCCHWVATAWYNWPGEDHWSYMVGRSVGAKPPYLTQSTKKSVGSTEGVCHRGALLLHQSSSWFFKPLWLVDPYTGRHHEGALQNHVANQQAAKWEFSDYELRSVHVSPTPWPRQENLWVKWSATANWKYFPLLSTEVCGWNYYKTATTLRQLQWQCKGYCYNL